MPKGAISAARSREASRRPGAASGFRVMKIQPCQTSRADLRQAHALAVEAVVAVHVGRVAERAVEVVGPGVVGAGDDLAPAGAGQQRRHPVQADVRHRPDAAVVVAQHDRSAGRRARRSGSRRASSAPRRGRRRSSRGRRCGPARRRSPPRRCRPPAASPRASVKGRAAVAFSAAIGSMASMRVIGLLLVLGAANSRDDRRCASSDQALLFALLLRKFQSREDSGRSRPALIRRGRRNRLEAE